MIKFNELSEKTTVQLQSFLDHHKIKNQSYKSDFEDSLYQLEIFTDEMIVNCFRTSVILVYESDIFKIGCEDFYKLEVI